MPKIRILSEQLTNKIAAGEVVQNPASIIKELVENSIDAGADQITVNIRNGGKTLCQVIDNGEGMNKDDLLLAFERYATSKIAEVEDLLNIRTLGFRGEALASIAAVAQLDAVSTLLGADTGHLLRIEGGTFKTIQPHSPEPGTAITVKSLFYNVPARRKFLKSSELEFRKIVDVMRKFALIHPEIEFRLMHNEREVFRLRKENLQERIVHLFSTEYRENLLPFEFDLGDMSVGGFIGNLNLVRARRGEQFFYVNQRFVSDRLMNNAIVTGYSGLLSRGEYPFYCIRLQLPPGKVDVNVHPSKMEVKFQEESRVYQFLKNSVGESLHEITKVAPDLARFAPATYYAPPVVPRTVPEQFPESHLPFDPQAAKPSTGAQQEMPIHFSQKLDQETWKQRAHRYTEQVDVPPPDGYSVHAQVHQLHNKYIISQVKSGLILIDQHVAHERILYEEALQSMQSDQWKAQQLLFPQVVELSVTDFSALLEILPYLEKLGFRAKEFGKQAIMVEAVPAGMRWGNEKTIIKEILDFYQEFGTKDTSIQSKVAASYSCKAAVKSGDPLTEEEMRNLVDRLFATKNPYFCPHGRPIIVNISLKELDKRFERI